MLRLLGICGSLRAGSANRMLLSEARDAFGQADYAEADLRLPLYDGDVEAGPGIPATVLELADQIARADAVIIASPEYNKALSGVLKNALDWVSRTKGAPWRDKPVAIVSAAAGRSGGERGQSSLRLCLNPFRANVLPGPEVLVANCAQAFTPDGRLKDDLYRKALNDLMQDLAMQAERHRTERAKAAQVLNEGVAATG